jgi:hypothetical protein
VRLQTYFENLSQTEAASAHSARRPERWDAKELVLADPPVVIWCATVPTNKLRQAYTLSVMPKNPQSLTSLIDRLDWMREEMLKLQRELERREVRTRDDSVVYTERRQL